MDDEDARTVWVGNLDAEWTTEELLYELFLQAGPIQYVRIPKHKDTGGKRNFGFVCFRDAVTVGYAIALLDGTYLCNRTLKVQSRHLQQLQQEGKVQGPGGIHTLNPFNAPEQAKGHHNHYQGNHNLNMHSHNHMQPYDSRPQQFQASPQSLLGVVPDIMAAARNQTQIPSHIVAMAQQQMALLGANPLLNMNSNPFLNSPGQHTSSRYDPVSYNSHSPYKNHTYQGGRDRGGRPGSIDNKGMQNLKSQFNDQAEENSRMLVNLQKQQGRFDYSRLGPPATGRSQGDYGQQKGPHNRYDDSHSHDRNRSHDRHGSHDRHSSGHDRHHNNHDRHSSSHNRHGSSYDRHGRSGHEPYRHSRY